MSRSEVLIGTSDISERPNHLNLFGRYVDARKAGFEDLLGREEWPLVEHPENLTSRNLTNDSDALRAVQAESVREGESHRYNDVAGAFLWGLLWRPKDFVNTGLRRHDFPSWTWAGWKSKVRWEINEDEGQTFTANVHIETKDCRLVEVDKAFAISCASQGLGGSLRYTPIIQREAEVIAVTFGSWRFFQGNAAYLEDDLFDHHLEYREVTLYSIIAPIVGTGMSSC
ncbi:hypothetical protein E8E11_003166 [Didymella keratinophila]|nr:hypothetical protein E8E11_003166 [Didymella keratinophila]